MDDINNMKPDNGQVSLWSSFDDMIGEAEEQFFELNFQKALQIWSDYSNITGTVAWQQNYRQLQSLITEFQKIDYSNPDNIFKSWLQIRSLLREKLKIKQVSELSTLQRDILSILDVPLYYYYD